MPARLETYNLLERLGPARVLCNDFLAAVDTHAPIQHLTRVYEQVSAESLINRMLGLDLKFTLADSDLPKVNRSCELAGLDVAYPLMDERIVAFSASLAPRLKLRGTRLRYFFKEALRGFLPDEIITKRKHGFGLPFGPWFQAHRPLRDLVMSSLEGLKSKGIIRPEFIDELTGNLVSQHSGYYGTMVWVLMMLEQWLAQHTTTALRRASVV
jgi:asparagine synthase (glutamine-hydrolysing)